MKILVVNAGSSSMKYQLFDMESGNVLAKGICEKIGITPTSGSITHKRPDADKYFLETPVPDHNAAIKLVLDTLTDEKLGVIKDISEIEAVGHRFVHGGKLKESTFMTDDILEYIESIVPINPLHGPASLKGVYACKKAMPNVPQVGVYDSAFYANMPEEAYTYAIPYEWTEKYSIRRYGFHGTSHRFVSQAAAKIVGKPIEDLKIISCHLGSGSSVTAIQNGIAIDTSMGFTPQDGLPMGTRCGPIDPSIVTFMIRQGYTADELDTILTKKSGMLGVSGASSDAREVWAAVDQGNKRAKLAIDLVVHYARKLIGGYVAEMNGVDVLIITAGLGENDNLVRNAICTNLECFGIKINEELNMSAPRGSQLDLTAEGSKVKVLVIPTDEELMIAKDTERLANEFYKK
ncbi:MAG: acetate kinase [Ruminococcaceae bacterium]|nr:acetate kinase [Oscillospiraceae bacterium]